MKKNKNVKTAILSYVGFFVIIATTVTAAVILYDFVKRAYPNDATTVAVIMLVVCLGLSLICSAIDALRRKRTVDASVEQILNATEQITAGNFNVFLAPRHSYKNYDDFDLIKENVNLMAKELSKNEVLKTDFISNVSHEIKTPLAIIQNYATALQNEKLSPDERKAYVKTLVQASTRLNDLVINVLKLNKLENQTFAAETQAVRLDETLAQAIFGFEDLIESKNLVLDCDVEEITLTSSQALLETVWNNLLSNAIKFTPQGGKISVSLKKNGDNAVVKIADTGIGMNAETGKRIFDKFYQGDASRAKEGNGLGLALVKKIIDVLGGEISVESELGKGTIFTVSIGDVK